MTKGKDFVVAGGRVTLGKDKVTITGKGNYFGTIVRNFEVTPERLLIKKINKVKKAKRKGYTQYNIMLKKPLMKKEIKYRIQVSPEKDFSRSVKERVYKVKKTKKVNSKYINSLTKIVGLGNKMKKGTTYYIRIRMEVGKGHKPGPWSNVETVKGK